MVGTKDATVRDVVFPHKTVSANKWGGNSITLTGKTIKKLGVEGKQISVMVQWCFRELHRGSKKACVCGSVMLFKKIQGLSRIET